MKDIFCKIIDGEIKSKTIFEDNIVKVIMDVNPKADGHLLIIPKKHYTNLFDIDNDVMMHIFMVAKDICMKLQNVLLCDGFTLKQNNGISQDIKHFHLHIIPKYKEVRELMNIEDVYNKLVDWNFKEWGNIKQRNLENFSDTNKTFYVVNEYEVDGPFYFKDIDEEANTEMAANYLNDYVDKLMNYFSINNLENDEVTVKLAFSLVIFKDKEKDFFQMLERKRNINNLVKVVIKGAYGKASRTDLKEDFSFVLDNNFEYFFVSFNDYISLLKRKGFCLDGVTSFEEVLKLIADSKPVFTKVSFSFDKAKIKKREL